MTVVLVSLASAPLCLAEEPAGGDDPSILDQVLVIVEQIGLMIDPIGNEGEGEPDPDNNGG
ncbi:MAG: hypothetical protein AAGN66_01745 [Acidobacteriota bacterium]